MVIAGLDNIRSFVKRISDNNGVIDEFGLFNVALTMDDIKIVMDLGLGATPVSPSEKVAMTWAAVKIHQ